MKKTIITLIITTMLLSLAPTMVTADQTSDTFTITVKGEYLYIEITPDTWNIGVVSMGSSTYSNTTGPYFTADTSDTNVNIDLKLQITNQGSDWSAATAGNGPGADTYRLNASSDNWATESQIVTASPTTIATITAGSDQTFDLRFDAPTSTSTGAEQTITITATITKA